MVSVAAMREMFGQLGTPAALKREISLPETSDHVIASQIISKDWQGVERESAAFLRDIVKL